MRINCYIQILAWVVNLYTITINAQNSTSFPNSGWLKGKDEIKKSYAATDRCFTGIPGLAISGKGKLWAVWYAGITPAEDQNNYVVVAASNDSGNTWEEVLVVDPDGPGLMRAFDPEVWIDPDGSLWVFWAQHIFRDSTRNTILYAVTTPDSESPDPVWSKPRQISNGVMMGKPVVLSGGEWTLPVSFWHLKEGSAKMVISTDRGRTWQIQGSVDVPVNVRSHDEHSILERKDGSLWMLVRTKYGIGESTSTDEGKTWLPLMPSKILNPSARFYLHRLQSGNILLVKNGPIDRQTKRSHLMAFISMDDGQSWSKGMLLHESEKVSYPYGHQAPDGRIYIIYDQNRTTDKRILMTSFTEEDLLHENQNLKMIEIYNRRIIVGEGGR